MAKKRTRVNGEGSYYKIAGGRWAGAIVLEDANGNPKRVKREGKTRAEVAAKLATVREAGITKQGDGRQLFGPFYTNWVDTVYAKRVRAVSAETARQVGKTVLIPHFGGVRLNKIGPDRIGDFLEELAAKYQPSYIRLVFAMLFSALKYAAKKKHIRVNPCADDDLEKPSRKGKTSGKSLMPAQAKALQDEARKDPRTLVIVRLGLLGMRRGEIAGLRLDDLHLDGDSPYLTIRGRIAFVPGEGIDWDEPKSPKSRRTIPLPAITVAAIRWYLARRELEQRAAGWGPSPYVFRNSRGEMIQPSRIWEAFKKAARAVGLGDFRLHDLRHSTASFLIAENIHPKKIQELLGHSSINITMDLYGHLMPDALRDVTDLLGAILDPPATPEREKREAE